MLFMKKWMKKIDIWDIGLVKWSVLFFTLWLVAYFPAVMNFVHNTNPWYFFVLFILAILRPLYRIHLK